MNDAVRIGVIGTGFIARGLIMALEGRPDMAVSRILTRSKPDDRRDLPQKGALTNSAEDLIEYSDVVVECTGDVLYATDVLDQALKASRPVITMDAEVQVTTGSYLAGLGYITEAEGDQPGCLATLKEEAIQMGFKPLVYGNIKGFLNHTPSVDEMRYWAGKQGISLDKVTSFTDGTKVQIEQALVANGLGAGIAQPGLAGVPADDVSSGGAILAAKAKSLGYPISDFILSPGSPAGVFIVAEHDEKFREYLRYYKMGDGPYYTLLRNYHLCNLEIIKTLKKVQDGGDVLLNNGLHPEVSVAAVAKRSLQPGDRIHRGIGSFDAYGSAVRIQDFPDHIPIGLLSEAVVRRHITPGSLLSFDDVEIPETLALDAWLGCAKPRCAVSRA
ncbi:NAD(P)-dependent oxidoreductase [Methanoculleus horonobensis]|uniref:NAD(P)-dependent oxidoreductase n=1 Tax=Methanoculleus horonobensis TaxID=528314 RepID=UPI00082FFF2A|nr:NAD(P)-dependent oxidoreductase [Methanoculleus horonobensis]